MGGESRRGADSKLLEDGQIGRVRRSGEGAPLVTGYKPSGVERARAIPGDQKFPFTKDPPDTEPAKRYLPIVDVQASVVQNPIPQVAVVGDFGVGDTIDVRGIRLITFFLEYFADGGELILAPQVAIEPPEAAVASGSGQPNNLSFFNIGVIDPVLTTAARILNCGGSRLFYATELRQDGAALTPDEPCTSTLVFDVAPYDDFRMLYGDTAAAAGLNAFYVRER